MIGWATVQCERGRKGERALEDAMRRMEHPTPPHSASHRPALHTPPACCSASIAACNRHAAAHRPIESVRAHATRAGISRRERDTRGAGLYYSDYTIVAAASSDSHGRHVLDWTTKT